MTIAIVFDRYASLIECINLDIINSGDLQKNFENWLYEDSGEGYLKVKESLNLKVLDISVVIRYITENYTNCIVTVIKDHIPVEEIDKSLVVIAL